MFKDSFFKTNSDRLRTSLTLKERLALYCIFIVSGGTDILHPNVHRGLLLSGRYLLSHVVHTVLSAWIFQLQYTTMQLANDDRDWW